MVRINCHSAFKHYEMFHNSCSGGSNYGSVFNTTYNINCGGHGGGFWGGFGAGLGNAFGSIFGGMFGGGMSNFGFGNFGMGGFGMGGFGMGGLTMPWFNSMGNFGWGGGNAGSVGNTNNNSGSNSSNGVNDKDNALIEAFEKKVDKLGAKNLDDAKALYKQIKEKYENPEDSTYKNQNKLAYSKLLDNIKAKYPNVTDWDADADKDKKADNDDKAAPKASTTSKQDVVAPPKVDKDAEAKKAEEAKANENAQNIANAGSLADLSKVDYNKLTPEEKEKYINKAIELAKSDATTPAALREALKGMPDEVRVKVKQSFYEAGYSNVKESEITAELLGKLQDVIDASKIADFKNVTLGTPKKDSNGKWTIPVKTYEDDNGKVHNLNVPYVQVEVVDGEVIFHGKQLTQKYVLQTDGKDLHLMQYKYHEGYGKGDVVRNQ